MIALSPVFYFTYQGYSGELGARPIEKILHRSGDWTLNFLLITLSLSPISRIPFFQWAKQFRKMAGLFAFFYASLHLLIYLGLEHLFDVNAILNDMIRHTRITIGILTYLMLLPLAITSTQGMIKRMTFKRWQRLHLLIYPASFGGVLHYILLVKKDIARPMLYLIALMILLLFRVPAIFLYFRDRWRG
jgi:sulfoxide reductase heme-binding subunit YedZ